MYDAVTDVLALFKIKGKPLLRKRKRRVEREPGLTGADLERRIDRWAADPKYSGRIH